MPYLILVLCLLGGGFLILRWCLTASPAQIAGLVRWSLLAVAVVIAGAIVVTQRWQFSPAAIIAAWPWISRLFNRAVRLKGPTPGKQSAVETAFFRMSLALDTGAMDGEVRAGTRKGARLSALTLDQLLDLRQECGNDPESVAVLESYLDRCHGAGWRTGAGEAAPANDDRPMSVEEARQVLGVDPEASDDEIDMAFRRLMKKIHPDQGGSDYLAAKINKARDVLARQ